MKDIYGHHLPIIEEEIMRRFDITMQCFDTKIHGEFGDTAAILEEAQKDLAADNATAAKAEYGRRPDIPFVTLENLRKARDRLHTLVENNDYSKTTLVDSVKVDDGFTMVSVPLLDLIRLINAGDDLHSRVYPPLAKDDWMEKADVIRAIISDQP